MISLSSLSEPFSWYSFGFTLFIAIGCWSLIQQFRRTRRQPRLNGPLKMEKVVEHLRERMMDGDMFERFRSRVVNYTEFVHLDDFPVQNIRKVQLKDQESPFDFAESITNQPLNLDLPLWECHVIKDYQGKAYCIWKIHHCIGDGMSLVAAFMNLSDNRDEIEQKIREYAAKMKATSANSPTKATSKKPSTPKAHLLLQLFWAVWVVIKKIGLLVIRPEPQTLLRSPGGKNKQLRLLSGLSVDEVKKVGKFYGGTLNDAVLGCVTGALRRVLQDHNPDNVAEELSIRAAIPVDMRGAEAKIKRTSNKFSSLMVELPVGASTLTKRMKRLIASSREAKFSLERAFVYMCSKLTGRLPECVMKPVVKLTTSNFSVAITNVRGPPFVLSFCGRRAISSVGFVPPPPTVNIGLAIYSSGNELNLSLLTDTKVIPDPDALLQFIQDEFLSMQAEVERFDEEK